MTETFVKMKDAALYVGGRQLFSGLNISLKKSGVIMLIGPSH